MPSVCACCAPNPAAVRSQIMELPMGSAAFNAAMAQSGKLDGDLSGDEFSDSDAGGDTYGARSTKPKSKVEVEAEDAFGGNGEKKSRKRDTSWPVCGLCYDGGDLLCCDGGCVRAFHLECLGLSESSVRAEFPGVRVVPCFHYTPLSGVACLAAEAPGD